MRVLELKKPSKTTIACAGLALIVALSLNLNFYLVGLIDVQGRNLIDLASEIERLNTIPRDASNYIHLSECHIEVVHFRNGHMIGYYLHPSTLTNGGKDFYEGKMYDSSFANASYYGRYIGLGNSTDSIDATWTSLHTEIVSNGGERALASYVSTGVGTCNLTKTFSITGLIHVRRYGIYWNITGESLMWVDSSNIKVLENGDTLKVTFMITDAQG